MPTYNANGITAEQIPFNHVITHFGVPQAIMTDHGSHFRQHMMEELTAQLGLRHDNLTPYYPQANGQVEAVNKMTTRFTLFQLVYGLDETLPIECEIPSLKLAMELLPDTLPEEERLLYLERLDETHCIAAMVIKDQKKRVKDHFDQTVSPHTFVECEMVLLYDQAIN
eukprot:PITA_34917